MSLQQMKDAIAKAKENPPLLVEKQKPVVVEKAPEKSKPQPQQPRKLKPGRSPQARDNRIEGKGRLPDGSVFNAVYIAEKKHWSGTLLVPNGEGIGVGEQIFAHSCSGVFRLMEGLDKMYRQSLIKDEVKVPEGTQ